ncbi:hypothetical protein [Streptomyces sp. NPDC050388]|uniref:hypothetical protein n=1 Tax=Streptomyces sp. NPDC050388 TaxID=3155781 RepID=UPI003425784E
MSGFGHVTVRIIPFGKGSFPGTGQSIDHLPGAVPRLCTVQLDTHHGGEFLGAGSRPAPGSAPPVPRGVPSSLTSRSERRGHSLLGQCRASTTRVKGAPLPLRVACGDGPPGHP